MNDVENKDQSAKADAGKLQLSLVDTNAIKTMATLEKHDQDERSRLSPVFIKKLGLPKDTMIFNFIIFKI